MRGEDDLRLSLGAISRNSMKRFHNLQRYAFFSFFYILVYFSANREGSMSRHASELTDAQWAHIAPLLPEPKASPKGGPKPIANRPVLRHFVGITEWSPLERPAGTIPLAEYLLASAAAWEAQDIWLKGVADVVRPTG